MAEAVRDRLRIDALGDEVGGVAVPEIVRANAREAETRKTRLVVAISDIVLVQPCPGRSAKHETVLAEAGPAPKLLLDLPSPE